MKENKKERNAQIASFGLIYLGNIPRKLGICMGTKMNLYVEKRRKRFFIICLCIIMACSTRNGILPLVNHTIYAADELKIPGKATGTNINVRKNASRTAEQLVSGKTKIVLKKNQAVTVLGEKIENKEKWYKVSFQYQNNTLKGYVLSDYIALTLKTKVEGKINSKAAVKVRTGAGSKAYLQINKKTAALANGVACTIIKETTVSGKKWFQIKFTVSKKVYQGYVLADTILFKGKETAVKTGTVTATNVNVRVGAGTDKAVVTYKGKKVKLGKGQKVTIMSEKKVEKVTWYQTSFEYSKQTLSGYISGDFVKISSSTGEIPKPTPTQKPEETLEPEPTSDPMEEATPSPSVEPTETPLPNEPLSDAEFESFLTEQGFPEDYKPRLRLLHTQYPLWQFNSIMTGLDWNEVVANETKVGQNLITNGKSVAWKSIEPGAYNWATDQFIPFDSSVWVTASVPAVAYYLDPRNFLSTDGIFQFEELNYNSQSQIVSGVENILKGTILSNASYTYIDSTTRESKSITYGETFIKAAEYSGVNPYHLATRVKQEVITSNGLSASATGNVSGYQGLYNFYNIGATHSTISGGNIANGLKFAKNGNGLSSSNQSLFLIPWNSPYHAIVGGAKYIGNNYINRGQNTVYLQKFNVTNTSRYEHQYMANVEAAKSEAQKTYAAYKNFTDTPVVFNIPVYNNMPQNPAPAPNGGQNPNNWLKLLSVDGGVLTPTFQVNNSVEQTYTLFVENNVSTVNMNALPVSSTAMVSGAGMISVNPGTNTVNITVTAQNGNIRTYIITIIRNT